MTDKQMQCLLTYLGYDPGEIDGIAGKRTQAALEAFRRDYGCGPEGLAGAVGGTVPKLDTSATHPPDPGQDINVPTTGTFWDSIRYFKREEFRCHCGGKYCNGFPVEPDEKMVRTLDAIREHFGKPITVTSGIRCNRWNSDPTVDGVSNSQHLYGTAADIIVSEIAPSAVAAYAETLLPNTGGVGRYAGFTHIDSRADKARWNG